MTAKIMATGVIVLLLAAGCASADQSESKPGAQVAAGQPATPQLAEVKHTITVDEARELLITAHAQTSDDVLLYVTATEAEFQKGRLSVIKAGRPTKAYPYQIREETPLEIVESTDTYAFVSVRYKHGFTGKWETMLFRFDRVEGKWLIANHTDGAGRWWPHN